ncbi:hypothetical protein [Methylobacterium sp. NEAU K]|uniref:hypothetical protein n=1 Tax=Methylobacterium sp. NEAU K TaxID=3064946 RepID=UPI0027351746|nr:hypothetical protein [Methylobacterium sp. NEAU K]MDP4004679.1 hypothetical protein [Methylobacterium sp. NEAU K]
MATLFHFPKAPRTAPTTYQAYRFSPNGGVRSTVPVDAPDDDEAERHAMTLLDGHRIELWSRGRFIAHVKP